MSWWGETGPSYRRAPARGAGSRRGFGRTWWGQAWVSALTERARLDPNRLSRGRSYARSGAVNGLTVRPGEVSAEVQGSRRRPYAVRVRVRELEPAEWDQLLNAIAAQVGRAAALLDGELPPEVEADVAAVGVELLPGPGELGPDCSCPDWADPCKHAAAVCLLVADVLDADPFALLHLRGRDRDSVLAGLRARRSTANGAQAGQVEHAQVADEGVPAADAYASWSGLPSDEPVIPLPPARPGRPTALPSDPPASLGPAMTGVADDLAAIASDAAARAWALATGDGDVLGLDSNTDLARIAATTLGTPRLSVLARRTGMPARELARRAIAWQHGGATGVAVVLGKIGDVVPPEAGDLRAARQALGAGARVHRGRITLGDAQLRWGPDGQWYGLRRRFGVWDLAGPPDPDPRITAEYARQ